MRKRRKEYHWLRWRGKQPLAPIWTTIDSSLAVVYRLIKFGVGGGWLRQQKDQDGVS
jgi:hypothetical protein